MAVSIRRLNAAAARRTRRLGKYLRLRRRWRNERLDPRLFLIMGCQRSGTSILLETLDRSPSAWVYGEGTNRALVEHRLRPRPEVRAVLARSPAPVVVAKPICDSQLTDQLLDAYPESRAVWIYRHYADVAHSQVVKWGDHSLEVIRAICDGTTRIPDPGTGLPVDVGWRSERLSDHVIAQLRAVPVRTPHDGAVLFWYLRNQFYFELGLDHDPRVLLVGYDRLLEDPVEVGRSVFAFAGCGFDETMTSDITPRRPGHRSLPDCSPEVVALADELLEKLDAALAAR